MRPVSFRPPEEIFLIQHLSDVRLTDQGTPLQCCTNVAGNHYGPQNVVPLRLCASAFSALIDGVESDHTRSRAAAAARPLASSTKYSSAAPAVNRMMSESMEWRGLPVATLTQPISSGPITAANLPSML
jgi:hypothetical protein